MKDQKSIFECTHTSCACYISFTSSRYTRTLRYKCKHTWAMFQGRRYSVLWFLKLMNSSQSGYWSLQIIYTCSWSYGLFVFHNRKAKKGTTQTTWRLIKLFLLTPGGCYWVRTTNKHAYFLKVTYPNLILRTYIWLRFPLSVAQTVQPQIIRIG